MPARAGTKGGADGYCNCRPAERLCQPCFLSGSPCAALSGASLLHRWRALRAGAAGLHYAFSRAGGVPMGGLPGGGRCGQLAGGVLLHRPATLCRHLQEGGRAWPGHHLPLLRSCGQHPRALLYRCRARPRYRHCPRRAGVVLRYRHRHDHGHRLPQERSRAPGRRPRLQRGWPGAPQDIAICWHAGGVADCRDP